MSISKKIIGVYYNLPSGGALNTAYTYIDYLSKSYIVEKLIEPKYKIKNIIHYLIISIIVSPMIQRYLLSKSKLNLLIVNHSWLVKSPSILRYAKVPVIYFCHEVMREYYDFEYIKNMNYHEKIINFIRLPIKWLDKHNVRSNNITIIANSNRSKMLIDEAYGVKSIVVYPGINTDKYKPKSGVKKINQIICVSAINKYKGQKFLVQVVSKIALKNRPRLVLVGNGYNNEYINELKELAKQLNVKLKLLFNISEEKKILELRKSKIFIYNPVSEPFGISVEEAISVGLPIAVHRKSGGFIEVITNQNGLIFDTFNFSEWATKIEKLLLDNKSLIKYSKYNSEYAVKYLSANIMNSKIKKIVESKL